MRPVIRDISSYDVADLESWQPGEAFWVVIQLEIGIDGEVSSDVFDLVVCSPAGFAEKLLKSVPIASGWHRVFMQQYDFKVLRNWLDKVLAASEGETWEDIAAKLSHIALWEWETYPPAFWDASPFQPK
jgi:Immunity protein 8